MNLKKLAPHAIAILCFAILTAVFFLPAFQGKQIEQHDIAQWIGMSKELTDFREKTGMEPLWTNSMFSGMPAYQISVLYPANLIRFLDKVLTLGLPSPSYFLFIMMVGFYFLLLSVKAPFRISMAGAIAFAFSSYHAVIILAGHNSKAHAIAYMPLVIAGILMVLRGNLLAGGIITAIALSLELYANHLQITYYLFITILILIICELIHAIRNKTLAAFLKSSAVLAVAALMGILPNITGLWATYEYGKYSTRSQSELTEKAVSTGLDMDYVFQYSYGISETFTLMIPRFKGGASMEQLDESSHTFQALRQNGVPEMQARNFINNVPLYFGDMRITSGPPYAGAIICFFFVLGILIIRGPLKWWLVAATVFSIVLAWGKNFLPVSEFFFHHFPGYNKFRAVSMMLVVAEFAIPFLSFLAFLKATDGSLEKKKLMKSAKLSLYITGGFCLLTAILPSLFAHGFTGAADESYKQYDWLVSAFRQDREAAVRMDALRSLFFIMLGFGLLWAFAEKKIKSLANASFILILIVLVDLWPVSKRYLNNDRFVPKSKAEKPFTPTQADLQIMADKEPGFRVLNTTVDPFNDASVSYFHRSIGGYHGAKLKRYQELIEYQISKNNTAVFNMLNTKYFIISNPQTKQPIPQINPDACGPAWFVSEIKMVANADSEMTALTDFNPLQTAIADKRFASHFENFSLQYDSTATIKLNSIVSNHLVYESNSSTEQFAVFSEIFYDKGWNAYVDGKLMPYIRVNYVLRGMRVPAGKHTIEFKFEPSVYRNGERIALISSSILLLLFIGLIVTETRKHLRS
jgi:hypothetical protein